MAILQNSGTNELNEKSNPASNSFRGKLMNGDPSPSKISHGMVDKLGALGEMTGQIADKTTAYVKTGRHYIQENPIKGAALAAAAGIVAGGLITAITYKRRP
jgi:hypothetical protein